ncbi:hypothetical protein BpHYR1_006087, partial [Brachionus plicatilis]
GLLGGGLIIKLVFGYLNFLNKSTHLDKYFSSELESNSSAKLSLSLILRLIKYFLFKNSYSYTIN